MFWDFQLAIILLSAFYYFVLRGRVNLVAARAFLLLIVPVAALIAFVDVPVLSPVAPTVVLEMTEASKLIDMNSPIVEQVVTWGEVSTYVYWVGVATVCLSMIIAAFYFVLLLRSSRCLDGADPRIRFTLWPLSGVSFFSIIVVGYRYAHSEKLATIVAHERVHAHKLHSLDVIYYWVIRAALWFNPAVWFSARALREVHEAQADRLVIEQGFSPSEYIDTLLRAETGLDYLPTNSLSYLKTKNRIKMITQKKPRHTAMRLSLALPLVGGMACFMSFTHPVADFAPEAEITVADFAQSTPHELKYRKGTISPSIKGKDTVDFMVFPIKDFISKSKAEAIELSDIVKIYAKEDVISILTGKEGNKSGIINVEFVNPTEVLKTGVKEYLRKIGATKVNYSEKASSNGGEGQTLTMDKVIPDVKKSDKAPIILRTKANGSLEYSSPKVDALVLIDGKEVKLEDVSTEDIESFTILKDGAATKIYAKKSDKAPIILRIKANGSLEYSSPKVDALVLIDGKEVKLEDVSTEDIESFTILKDGAATKIYGKKGENGVIIIRTKKAQNKEKK